MTAPALIRASINTLQRDLLEEAIIVSFVTIAFLFHFRSALDPNSGSAHCGGRLFHSHVFPQCEFEHHVTRRTGARNRCTDRRQPSSWSKTATATCRSMASRDQIRAPSRCLRSRKLDSYRCRKTGGPGHLLFAPGHLLFRFCLFFFSKRRKGRMFRPLAWTKTTGRGVFLDPCHHPRARSDGHFYPWPTSP